MGKALIQPSMYCRRCRYVLDGLPVPRCPECGTGFDPNEPATWLPRYEREWQLPLWGKRLASDLCWLAVLALPVLAFVMPNLVSMTDCSLSSATRAQLGQNSSLGVALNLHRNHTGRYPTTLSELTQNIDGSEKWGGPYIDNLADMKDAWGNAFQYRFPAASNGKVGYDLWSFGPDSVNGTADDIWN
jgi:general secretion pathway protein G